MSHAVSDPKALLDIVSRLDGLIGELKDIGLGLPAQLVAMARLELIMTAHHISEHELGALRSLIGDKPQMLS